MKKEIIAYKSQKRGEWNATLSICQKLKDSNKYLIRPDEDFLAALASSSKQRNKIYVGTGEEYLKLSSQIRDIDKNAFIVCSHHRLPLPENLACLNDIDLILFPSHIMEPDILLFLGYSQHDIEQLNQFLLQKKSLFAFGVPTNTRMALKSRELFSSAAESCSNSSGTFFISLPSEMASRQDIGEFCSLCAEAFNNHADKYNEMFLIQNPRSGNIHNVVLEALDKKGISAKLITPPQGNKTGNLLKTIHNKLLNKPSSIIISPYSSITQTIEFLKIFPTRNIFLYGMKHDGLPEKFFGKLVDEKFCRTHTLSEGSFDSKLNTFINTLASLPASFACFDPAEEVLSKKIIELTTSPL